MHKYRSRILKSAFLVLLVAFSVAYFSVDWRRHRIAVNGGNREYLFYAPSNAKRESLPLLVAYHGFSGTADRMRQSSKLHEMVEEQRFYLVYTEGDPTWHRPHPDRPCPDVDFFDALCDSLTENYSIDEDRIYVTGMSMGGDFVIRLGGLRSNRIAAVASQGMITRYAVDSERPFPLMIIVGTEDKRVPKDYFPRVPDEFREQGHTVEVLRPEGIGHWWHRPLNVALWEFLSSHRLQQRGLTVPSQDATDPSATEP